MPRQKYVITSDDVTHARSYLEFQLRTYGIELRDDVTLKKVEREFSNATSNGTKSERARQLNLWCEQYLSSSEWRKLKSAIRKRRERRQNPAATKSVTISAQSHEYLTKLALRDHVTLSEVLEKYLSKALKQHRYV